VSNGPSFYIVPVVISTLHGKTSRVVERPIITHFTSSFSLLYNYTAHETMDFTFQWYHKVVIIIVQCIKGKTLSLAHVQHNYYNGSNILTHLWSIKYELAMLQHTLVWHMHTNFFQYACALYNAYPQWVTEYVCINTWIE